MQIDQYVKTTVGSRDAVNNTDTDRHTHTHTHTYEVARDVDYET
jgi:hypothetical protein